MGQEFGRAISFFGCVAGTGPFLFARIWGTRQYENTNIAGSVALAQVNHFGSRSSNKLCVILRFVSDRRKKHNAGGWQKKRIVVGRCLHMYMILKNPYSLHI